MLSLLVYLKASIQLSWFKLPGWRWMLGISGIPGLFQLVALLFFMPESPRWLIQSGSPDKAFRVMAQLNGTAEAKKQRAEIEKTINAERNSSWKNLFSVDMRAAFVVGIGLQILQQFCGINTVMYYSATIITMTGFSVKAAIYFSNLVALANSVSSASI